MKYAAYCGSREVYKDMEMSAKSLIANSDVDEVYFFIEDDETSSDLPSMVKCVNVSDQAYFPKGSANYKTRYTYLTLIRAALCKLMPQADKVLSLDCDTIAINDCSMVWDIPIDGCYFAATLEHWHNRKGFEYCNTGVALYNLEQLRDGKANEVIDVLNKHYFEWAEQDAFNYLCQGRIALMDSAYNYGHCTVNGGAPRILHYAGKEDWRDTQEAVTYYDTTWARVMELHDDFLSRIARVQG